MHHRVEFKNLRFLVVDSSESFSMDLGRYLANVSTVDLILPQHSLDFNASSYQYVILNNESLESSIKFLDLINSLYPMTKVIILVDNNISVSDTVALVSKGCYDCLVKDSPSVVCDKILNKISKDLKGDQVKTSLDFNSTGIIGVSPSIKKLFSKIEKLKDVDSTVLITGETGTGKELVALALHRLSSRSSQPYEALNCSAIPENLLESELFGYKKGAFTDAKTDHTGLLQRCSQGVLFLDEIADMPLKLQAKILRVLQDRVVRPIGSSSSFQVNTRIIAATNKNLLNQDFFRQDLYYRLCVLTIDLPPLRERPEDIDYLVRHFLEIFNKKYEKDIKFPSPYILEKIRSYSWPGNIRELQNALERSVILSSSDHLNLEDIFSSLQKHKEVDPYITDPISIQTGSSYRNIKDFTTVPTHPGSSSSSLSLIEARKNFEKSYITNLMALSDGNISKAAKMAGKHRTEIYRLISRYNIDCSSLKNIQ